MCGAEAVEAAIQEGKSFIWLKWYLMTIASETPSTDLGKEGSFETLSGAASGKRPNASKKTSVSRRALGILTPLSTVVWKKLKIAWGGKRRRWSPPRSEPIRESHVQMLPKGNISALPLWFGPRRKAVGFWRGEEGWWAQAAAYGSEFAH